ncbi:peptidyl-prolyl cis-trans isomerase FKBP14 [Gasterosteus aculeatus]|uniref:peptidylprolyl isomerase n=1 Tax=Gasterosteus aculeatus aculeatus TaxID=481459 RepID=G3NZJ4_GASAC|nr:peptidyl-prolyl cis-trans isomerase FKBP14 [Gasterosteus aculeatus aculeatus]
MILFYIYSLLASLFVLVTGGKLPEPEVKIEVLHKPFMCYRKSKYGDMLLVHHEGFLESNGTMFYSSREHGDKNPVWFTLGMQEVLKGWDKGLKNMCTGERRKLTIPPSLGYGKEGKGKIPPSSILIFHIELMDIRNGPRSHESFREMDLNDDWKLCREEVKEYLKKEFEKHGYSPNDTNHEAMVEDIFKNEDEDKDGFISAREFTYQHDEL